MCLQTLMILNHVLFLKTEPRGCTEHQIYTAENVKWQGIELLPVGAERPESLGYYPKLKEVRASTLNKLTDYIRLYFPHDEFLENLGVFDYRPP